MDRAQHPKIRRELDFAGSVARRERNIDDPAIVRIIGAHGEVDASHNFLISTSRPEGHAAEDRLAAQDFDAGDAPEGRRNQRGDKEKQQRRAADFHFGGSIRFPAFVRFIFMRER
ncbi:MAG TPA: hypothetical protein VFE06_16405 [Acidobacteriaceae bacterium]|nr:hypothetical protein [Acidobacteriaceae bacterium]